MASYVSVHRITDVKVISHKSGDCEWVTLKFLGSDGTVTMEVIVHTDVARRSILSALAFHANVEVEGLDEAAERSRMDATEVQPADYEEQMAERAALAGVGDGEQQ